MKKIFLAGLLMAMAGIYAIESIEPGMNPLKAADHADFDAAGEHIVGGGDTCWTQAYDVLAGGYHGIFVLSFDIDTFAACSSKVQVILQEGNTLNDWDLLTSVATINHAPSDWDTTMEIELLPAACFRIGWVLLNGTNDSNGVKNPKLLAVMR